MIRRLFVAMLFAATIPANADTRGPFIHTTIWPAAKHGTRYTSHFLGNVEMLTPSPLVTRYSVKANALPNPKTQSEINADLKNNVLWGSQQPITGWGANCTVLGSGTAPGAAELGFDRNGATTPVNASPFSVGEAGRTGAGR